ncbi:energy transducer TonB [Flavobacterium hydatis]|uniref:Energy transducer TonB n=1 Tax=Flavobacterium hydatis TaxID=991 RepID=A0A085ZYX0_FLAHY|nr:energy transducer TonB [Flavobacterium hydatis]KFF09634.1 hypothetical protein IW20_22880 [Flavobacterium hydatis]OXA95048.1 energy transducer TonB [Flavobacterium hydatis]
MSTSSIYENKWIDLVFENRNKEYGAYQLRHESSKNSIKALFMGLFFTTAIVCASMFITKLSKVDVITTIPDSLPTVVQVSEVHINKKSAEMPAVKSQPVETAIEKSQLVNPTIVEASKATPQEIATVTENIVTAPATTGEGDGKLKNGIINGGGGPELVTAPTINEPTPIGSLDKLPEFPGGMNKFYTYVGNNFNRPELDSERTIRIYVSFVIERDGSMTDILVRNDPGYGLGKEAIRVLKSLRTKWTPGMIDSKPVRTAYNLPITIKTE